MSSSDMVKIGPVGNANLGEEWSEKGKTKISGIYICHTPSAIASLQFRYIDMYGYSSLSELYGTSNGSKFNVVQLGAVEYITGVEGMLDPVNGIRSLTFITNMRKFGPFGFNRSVDGGSDSSAGCSSYSSLPLDLQFGGRFGGFNGRTKNGRVTSIGVYLM